MQVSLSSKVDVISSYMFTKFPFTSNWTFTDITKDFLRLKQAIKNLASNIASKPPIKIV